MQPGARLEAAIEVLGEIAARGRAASVALADWGRAHRFGGSADRAWIGNLVFDSLRRKQSLAYLMDSEAPRSIALAALRHSWDMTPAEIAALCSGERFCPEPLTPTRRRGSQTRTFPPPALGAGRLSRMAAGVLFRSLRRGAILEGQALAERAPADLRVNSLKAAREKVLKALERHGAVPTPYSPLGVRLPPREGGARSPNVEAEPGHGRGWFEVQDEGSQIAALLAGAGPRMQVADICAGAGGETSPGRANAEYRANLRLRADAIRFRPISSG